MTETLKRLGHTTTLRATEDGRFLIGRATTGRWYVAATEKASIAERDTLREMDDEHGTHFDGIEGAREHLARVREAMGDG